MVSPPEVPDLSSEARTLAALKDAPAYGWGVISQEIPENVKALIHCHACIYNEAHLMYNDFACVRRGICKHSLQVL